MNELRTTLDMGKETYVALKCKQNDDRTLILTLLSNGIPWIPEVDSILELRGKRSDNTVTIQTTTDITIVDNVVTIELSKEFTKVQGTVELELNIRKLTEITTFTFTLVIEPSVIQDGAIVSKNTSSLLEELTDITGWRRMHLNNAIDNVVNLTKKHSQYSVGLVGNVLIRLPVVAEGEYVDIDYMFYADSELMLNFGATNIYWSSSPFVQLTGRYIFNFKYIEGDWWATWSNLGIYIKDYIYRVGDLCSWITGGYTYVGTVDNLDGKLQLSGTSTSVATTINNINIDNYDTLYLEFEFTNYNVVNQNMQIWCGDFLLYQQSNSDTRKILTKSLVGAPANSKIIFRANNNSKLTIYNAWFA